MTRLIALSGSLRHDSYNQQLVARAAEGARSAGAEVTLIHLVDYAIPLFSEDLEALGTPAAVNDLKRLFADSDGILLASPEYNGSIPGVLKNVLDWLSRPGDGQIASAFAGKVAGIMATSPGALGGVRGLAHVKDVLFNLGVRVNPAPIAVPGARQAFTDTGALRDSALDERVLALGREIARQAELQHH